MRWCVRSFRAVKAGMAGGGLYTAGALIAGFIATVFLVAILLSPNGWKWWASVSVHGAEQGGVVSYSYRGQTYSLDDLNSTANGSRIVYLNPAHPNQAALSIQVTQISDSVVTGGPYLVCVCFGVVAFRRHRTTVRRNASPDPDRFGDGIDSGTIRRIVASKGRT